jgi:hypothetical protein
LNRRTFLKRGLLGGALLALGGGTMLAFRPTRYGAAPTRALVVLDPRAFQVLVAVARRIVTTEGADPVAIAHGIDGALASSPPEAQADIGKLLMLFENALGGLLFDGRVTPFTHLSPGEQDRVLERWRDSKLALRRTGYQALRKLCLASYYAMPSSWGPVHYPPPMSVGEPYDDSKMGTPEWLAEHGVEGPL